MKDSSLTAEYRLQAQRRLSEPLSGTASATMRPIEESPLKAAKTTEAQLPQNQKRPPNTPQTD
jgi:hypothetical protein